MAKLLNITMPQPGETITQGTVVAWRIKPGDSVKEKDVLAELETEKAVFEYESPFEGKIVELRVNPPATVGVGEPIAVMEVADDKADAYRMLGMGGDESPVRKEAHSLSSAPEVSQQSMASFGLLSPYVRKLIREHRIPEAEVNCLRRDGRVTKSDIEAYLSGHGAKEKEGDEIIPCSPIRLRIAENMILSKSTIPHAHTGLTVDMTRLVEYREKNKAVFQEKNGFPLGITAMIFPALSQAIKAFPIVNSSFRDEGKKSVVLHRNVHLGLAVDTDRGLYVVTVRDAQNLNFPDFAQSLNDAVKRAKANKLRPEDLTGMTFTLNNYGFYGTRFGVQIILPPQATTLGMGKIEKRPWIVDDGIHIRHLTDLTMAFDHRVMDGRDAGLFLQFLKEKIEAFREEDLS